MTRSDVLDKAKEVINNDRNATYGNPEENLQHTANYWNSYLVEHGLTKPITAGDVGAMMTLLKIARLRTSPQHADNYVDGVGYLAIAGSLNVPEQDKTGAIPLVLPERHDNYVAGSLNVPEQPKRLTKNPSDPYGLIGELVEVFYWDGKHMEFVEVERYIKNREWYVGSTDLGSDFSFPTVSIDEGRVKVVERMPPPPPESQDNNPEHWLWLNRTITDGNLDTMPKVDE